jgi:hypothetical protein
MAPVEGRRNFARPAHPLWKKNAGDFVAQICPLVHKFATKMPDLSPAHRAETPCFVV